jgi:hypothetical protein
MATFCCLPHGAIQIESNNLWNAWRRLGRHLDSSAWSDRSLKYLLVAAAVVTCGPLLHLPLLLATNCQHTHQTYTSSQVLHAQLGKPRVYVWVQQQE